MGKLENFETRGERIENMANYRGENDNYPFFLQIKKNSFN